MTQELRDVFVELADGSVRKVALQAQTFTTSDEPDTVYESRTLKWSVGDSGALTVHAFGTDRDRSQEDGFGAGVELSLATFARRYVADGLVLRSHGEGRPRQGRRRNLGL